ncbi:DUF7711 family protein [Actinoplanes awajinensis]|uniref:DUF7711 domain-containing protein n=1 Tax=Actinoplanes awajinensis subsp. mycoplanecinus TaxID=135947 RepID=A0A101JLY3_9ACTN|nr:hypothetical protein [Actinoplanes awajinensis]KUL29194.1 hypothetical protein ADL15_28965 [Actinoplanes awajinensis subsp. mycoplanecinus]
MKYGTAVKRLQTIADRCQHVGDLDELLLVGAYAFGAVLDEPGDLDFVQVAFVLDLPPDDLPWHTQPQSCSSMPYFLQIDKGGVDRFWRSASRPVSNHRIVRPLRIWSREDGPDAVALDALRRGEAEELRPAAPGAAELREQLTAELATSLAHLRRVEGSYWEREWRRDNRGGGTYPENHLWDATHGYLDLLDAIS